MKKEEKIWDFVKNCIIISLIAILIGIAWNLHITDVIPKSEEGQTFIYLNVEHCANTYHKLCWVSNDEYETFERDKDYIIMTDFPDRWLVFR